MTYGEKYIQNYGREAALDRVDHLKELCRQGPEYYSMSQLLNRHNEIANLERALGIESEYK